MVFAGNENEEMTLNGISSLNGYLRSLRPADLVITGDTETFDLANYIYFRHPTRSKIIKCNLFGEAYDDISSCKQILYGHMKPLSGENASDKRFVVIAKNNVAYDLCNSWDGEVIVLPQADGKTGNSVLFSSRYVSEIENNSG